jgi:1-acyl-sn-glycerol-3-phosphate acyltransferase
VSTAAPPPGREPFATRWARRAISIGGVSSTALLLTVTAPLWLPLLGVLDLVLGGRVRAVRFVTFFWFFLLCEVGGVVVAFFLWWTRPAGRRAFLRRNFALQTRWAALLMNGARRLFRLSFDVEGEDCLDVDKPLLVMIRHVSIGDTLIPAYFIARRTGRLLRYVLKRELLWDPCLDIVGQRLPNTFVRRGTGDRREIEKLDELSAGLGADEGVLIFPEGTRFTPSKREQVLRRLAAQNEPRLLEAAADYQHVLPPRLGGALRLLNSVPDGDVVFCAHTGFEGISTLGDLWRGSLMDRTIRVRFWRAPRASIPADDDGRAAWLLEQWRSVDAVVEEGVAGLHPSMDAADVSA